MSLCSPQPRAVASVVKGSGQQAPGLTSRRQVVIS